MSTDVRNRLADLYLEDETAWLDEMSRLAADRRLDDLDCENLSEYLESMANRDRREVDRRMVVLLAHLLKWEYQPSRRGRSWRRTILTQKMELRSLVRGVLRNYAIENLAEIYRKARQLASAETDLPLETFPESWPGTVDDLLAEDAADSPPSE